ncbi:urease accessory protein UreF [Streptococcus sp. zg-JUN1979]|uniref:urease accessory protein UreF n=1 Tax=Streptococcus sp. zg-JUN1979 TaxID=3391450 RepID=UPI0039A4668C
MNFLDYLDVFQVCDSTFPIGSFNHSFGMEHYLFERTIQKGHEFAIWLKNYYQTQFRCGEGLLIKLTYGALEADDFEQLLANDRIMDASTIASETRSGTRLIAKQMLSLLQDLYGTSIPHLEAYQKAIKASRACGNPAIVFAIFAHYKKVPLKEAFLMYGYSVGSTLVQNAVRAVPLGQKEGQVILNQLIKQLGVLYQEVLDLDPYYLGANSVGLELAQIKHERQEARLFMS